VKAAIAGWAIWWLLVAASLMVSSRRIGRRRAAAWTVVIGLFLLVGEEPALTFWLGLSTPAADPDGMATMVTPMARAHVMDAGVFGVAAAVLLGRIALTGFARGEPGAERVLRWGWIVALLAEAGTTTLVFSRGLPLPGPAGAAGATGFGWAPVAVGLLAWAGGLWLARSTAPARQPSPDDGPPHAASAHRSLAD
jgi:hypothetical protein